MRRSAPGRVVFTSFHGRSYRGNPKHLFRRLLETGGLDPVWLSTSREVVTELQERFGASRACFMHSRLGLRHLAEARAVVFNHGTSDFPHLHLSRKALLIQTFHGLPTKRGELLATRPPPLLERWSLWRRFAPTDVFLSSSPFVSEVYAARFGLPRQTFLELGYPVHDELIERARAPLDTRKHFPHWPSHERVVLYAPTFRRQRPTRFFPFDDLAVPQLAAFLERYQVQLLLRPHPNEPTDLRRFAAATPRIRVLDQQELTEVYELLPSCSAVVTDYSALSFEAALVDVPSVLLPYDLKHYERGLVFDLPRVAPGPLCYSQADFLAQLKACFEQPQAFADARQRARDVFFTHSDGRATERVAEWLTQTLKSGARPGLTRQLEGLWSRGLGKHVQELPIEAHDEPAGSRSQPSVREDAA